jgi:hypothetical protein
MRQIALISVLLCGCASEYRGWIVELHGQVLDEDNEGVDSADVRVETASSDLLLGQVSTDSEGRWRLPLFVEEGQENLSWPLHLSATASGFGTGDSYWSFSWTDDSWPASPISLGPGQVVAAGSQQTAAISLFSGEGQWSSQGRVVDVLSANPLGEVNLRLRKGWNAPTEAGIVQEVESDNNGDFSFVVEEQGVYTVEAVAPSGYSKSLAVIRMGPGAPDTQLVLMSPPLGNGELRAALIWRNSQRDLDLHMSGPLAGSGGRYQVYVDDTPHPINGPPVAQVEWSDGRWESIGLYTTRSGDYRFSAHDVDNQILLGSTALSEAGASLLLWTEAEVVLESLFPGSEGTLWRGLEVQATSGSIFRLQEMDEARDAWDVSAF